MAKASEILGRPLVIREGGRAVGKVKDLVVDEYGKRVLGFVVSEGLFKTTRVALYASVQTIGPDSVIIGTVDGVVKAVDAPDISSVLDKNQKIRGIKVQTTGGKDLGEVNDFEFDESSGVVLGYELSGGLFADVFGGRSFPSLPRRPSSWEKTWPLSAPKRKRRSTNARRAEGHFAGSGGSVPARGTLVLLGSAGSPELGCRDESGP